jgi:hypothetical protein
MLTLHVKNGDPCRTTSCVGPPPPGRRPGAAGRPGPPGRRPLRPGHAGAVPGPVPVVGRPSWAPILCSGAGPPSPWDLPAAHGGQPPHRLGSAGQRPRGTGERSNGGRRPAAAPDRCPRVLAARRAGARALQPELPGNTARYALVAALARLAARMPIEQASGPARAIVRLGTVLGPVLSGILIATIGAANVLFVDAVTRLDALGDPTLGRRAGSRGLGARAQAEVDGATSPSTVSDRRATSALAAASSVSWTLWRGPGREVNSASSAP